MTFFRGFLRKPRKNYFFVMNMMKHIHLFILLLYFQPWNFKLSVLILILLAYYVLKTYILNFLVILPQDKLFKKL